MHTKWFSKSRDKVLRRLVFAATERCECGAGLAYNSRTSERMWDCSAILLGDALFEAGERGTVNHRTPCNYPDIVSELSPDAHGATTRPTAPTAA